jgi:hypothetical protein
MASLILSGSTSGSVTLSSPAVSGTTTLTLPTTSGTVITTASGQTLTSPTIATPTITGQATIPTINLTGGQITFPATQSASSDANTLDDYEEGTWTPTVGGTATYSSRTGIYIKIGNLVWIYGELTISSIGTGQTNNISGLPFGNGGGGTWEATIPVDKSQNLSTSITWMALRISGTSLYATTRTAASSSSNINPAFMTTSTLMQFAGCYSV